MNRTVIFRIRAPGYLKAAGLLSALLVLAGCGGGSSSSSISDVEKAVRVRSPDSSSVRCERHGDYRGATLYRCRMDVPVSVREMRPESSCYTFEDDRLNDVTRQVSC
jgi:hypothetical protein